MILLDWKPIKELPGNKKINDLLYHVRGIGEDFLRPKADVLISPLKLYGIVAVLNRIHKAIENNENITLSADPDV